MESDLTEYDNALIQSAVCIENQEFDKAIEVIKTAFEKERDEGRDSPELAISNARWIGMILEKKGNLQEALDVYCLLDMPKNTSEYGLNQLDIIGLHYRMGSRAEAARILNQLLTEEIDDALGYGMFLLKMGTEIIDKPCENQLFIRFAKKIESILNVKGFQLDTSTDAVFIEGLMYLWETEQSSGLNFSELNMSLIEVDAHDVREGLIRQYIKNESVGYYQVEALKLVI